MLERTQPLYQVLSMKNWFFGWSGLDLSEFLGLDLLDIESPRAEWAFGVSFGYLLSAGLADAVLLYA